MRCRFFIAAITLLGFVAVVSGAEKLDRGLVALEREDGSVFLSLMQDRQYRMGVVAQTMGYYYPAQQGN